MPRILTVALNPAIDVSSEADSVRTSHKVRTYNETYDPGGGGVNVARVVTELGGDVEVLYLAGGATGTLLGELLDRNRIRRQLIRIAGNTRISFTVQERSTGREFRFVGNGPTVDATELGACLDAIRASDFNYLVASGSLPIGVPPDTFAILAGIAAAKGRSSWSNRASTSSNNLSVTPSTARRQRMRRWTSSSAVPPRWLPSPWGRTASCLRRRTGS